MGFLAPAAFALAVLGPVIIAMYLLKLRRTEQVVSSVYLWRRLVRDVEANAPWQRLRRNLLLLLQLLFLAALILALARPFRWAQGASGQAVILILDTSASMAASDVEPNRLESAKTRARQLIDGLPDDARVTVITASDGAQVLVASSQDQRQIQQAVDSVQPGTGGTDLTSALELASAIAARQPETEIIVLSDGRATLPERLAVTGRVRYLPVGQTGGNQAISTLSLEPAPNGESTTAFAQVTNYGRNPVQRRLALYADGQLFNAYDLEIPPGGQQAVVADDLPSVTRVLDAQLTGQDALALDDRAWAVHRDSEPIPVTLVSDGNRFLETGLSLLPGIQVTTVRPEDFEAAWEDGRMEGWKDGDLESDETSFPNFQSSSQSSNIPIYQSSILTIFDSYVPLTSTLPVGNLLVVAPPRSTELFTVTGTVDLPTPRIVDAEDPLLAHLNLDEVNVLEAARIPLPDWARPLIAGDPSTGSGQAPSGETTPLLFAGEVDGRRVAVLAFDLRRSDLPLQVAFPLLLANLTNWLAPGGGGDLPTQVSPGTAVTLSLPPEVEAATVTRPDGSTARLIPERGQAVFVDTAQLGVYNVKWESLEPADASGVDQASFAVNLFSPQESDLRPAETLPVPGIEEVGADTRSQQARREWCRPLALFALALLTAEWLVYHRGSLARIWKGIKRNA